MKQKLKPIEEMDKGELLEHMDKLNRSFWKGKEEEKTLFQIKKKAHDKWVGKRGDNKKIENKMLAARKRYDE